MRSPRLGGLGPSAAQTARALPDFDGLWDEAKRWAVETGTVPEDCVFDFRFDPKTNAPRDGRAVTCDEPYRSPFYPYPEPSRPGVRFTADDIRSYARDFEAVTRRPPRPGGTSDEALFETCRLIVGFSAAGRGAEAIECHWREGGVLGQRANSGYVVEKEGGRRVTSRLHDRIAHLKDRAMREIAERVARAGRTDGPSELQIEGKVIGRDGHRLMIRGQARPVFGGSSAEPGVVTSESDLVVEYPSDDALRPGYYFAGEHCFKDKREKVNSARPRGDGMDVRSVRARQRAVLDVRAVPPRPQDIGPRSVRGVRPMRAGSTADQDGQGDRVRGRSL